MIIRDRFRKMSSTLKCNRVSRQKRKLQNVEGKGGAHSDIPDAIIFTDLLLDVFAKSEDSNTIVEAVKKLATQQKCTSYYFYCDPITKKIFKPNGNNIFVIESANLSLTTVDSNNGDLCVILINIFDPLFLKQLRNNNIKYIILVVNWLNEYPITEGSTILTCLLFKNEHQKQCENIIKYENFTPFYKNTDVQLLTINDLLALDENYILNSNSIYVFVLQNTDINFRFFKIFYYSIIFKWMKWSVQIVELIPNKYGLFKILNKQFHDELNTLINLDIRNDLGSIDNSNIKFTSDLQSVLKCCPIIFDPENNVFKSCDVRYLISTAKELAKTVCENGLLPDKYYIMGNKPNLLIGGKMWKPSMMTSACLRTVGVNFCFIKRFAPNFMSGIAINNYYRDLLDIVEDTWL